MNVAPGNGSEHEHAERLNQDFSTHWHLEDCRNIPLQSNQYDAHRD